MQERGRAADIKNVTHTLLLADDSLTIQRVIELTFADEDVQVVAVSDGDQAIARLDASPPDIVLADVGMPGRDGYEVARYIRQTPKLAHIPVVLLTGAFEPVDQAKASEVGCDGVLAKPFEPQLVIGRVKELLANPGRTAEAETVLPLPPVPAATSAPNVTENLDAYFDRLDNAFAHLSTGPAPNPPQPPPPAAPEPDLPLSYGSPAEAFESAAATSVPFVEAVQPSRAEPDMRTPPVEAPPAPAVAPPLARELPSVSDAFAAILAAEQAEGASGARPMWPVAAPPPPHVAPELSADVIDEIVQRVVAQLTDRVVRDRVSEIAERLIRDEIDRIKAAIK